jgi:hypothetical protein
MKVIQLFWKDFCLGVVLFLAPFFLPRFSIGDSSSTLVTATSAVFAIVAGFFIADAMSNYLRLQTLIAEENASLISLADDARRINGKNFINVYRAIDEYMIAQLDAGTLNHILKTEKEFGRIIAAVDTLQSGPGDKDFFDHILSMEEKILMCRQEISLAAKKNLTPGHWAILVILAALVATTVLTVRDGNLLTNFVVAFIIVAVQAVLVLLREMDGNYFLENKLAFENPREVFQAVSQPPYYPYFSSPRSHIPNEAGLYRLGKEPIAGRAEGYDTIDTAQAKT